ncbi:MAG TPA: OmpA family protein, partial [Candidatus Syntrophosphaera sp.]|nr:OmpA family protein [Candidatus Syntrophosphaera sp.]
MSKISKTLLITLLLLALMPAIHAFESTLTIEGGVGIPLDDIEGTNKMKGAWALSWDAWMIKDWLGVGISPWFANVEVEGDDPNESYFSSLEGINLYLKLRPTKAGALNFQEKALVRRISPFVALGGGWSTHGSRDENGVGSNPSVPAGFRGHFTLPHAAAGISFLSKWNTTLDLGVKYDLFTKDNIDLTDNAGNHFENDALLTPYVGLGIHFGTPKAVPELIYDGKLDAFSTVVGTPSAAQSYKLKGKNLKGDIDLVAPEGFVLSIDGGKVWAKSVRAPADFDGDIWVRLTGEKAGTYDGSIGHQSKGTGGLSWPVNGVVREPLLPTLSLVSSGLGTFSTELGTPPAPQSYKIKAKDLTGDIVINAPAGFEFSLDGGKTYASSMRVPAEFDKDILVRLTGAQTGKFEGNISHASPGAGTFNLPVNGTVKEAVKPEEPEQGNPILDQLEQDLLKHTVHFDTNLYTIRDGDKPFLDRVAEALKKLPEIMIEIQGHTDSTGSDKINEPLSYNRAKVVKDYLVARGVDAE